MPQNVASEAENVVAVRVEGEFAYLTLNRPAKRNAINNEVLRALPLALQEVNRPDVRAIILHGEGQVFSAGIDFTSLGGGDTDPGGSGGGPDMTRFRHFVHESQMAPDAFER